MTDMVNHPPHYTEGRKYEPIDVIEDWQLSYRLGSAIKYISRAGRKDPAKTIEDLKKCRWYLDREIAALEGQQAPYSVTYEDVLEDYAACSTAGYTAHVSLDEYWDPSVGPTEPEEPTPSKPIFDRKTLGDYIGQAEWAEPETSLKAPSICNLDTDTLCKDLDQFEDNEILTTFERRGLILGADKYGRTYVLGSSESTA